jgi:hypothetical protein
MKLHRALALLLCAGALAACEKNAVQDLTGPLPSARIKFYNFSVGSPGVNFFANDTKMTAIASATGAQSTLGIGFGGVAAGDRYTAIAPGQYTLSGRISAAVDNGLAISSVNTAIADGRFYSYYQAGIYDATTRQADAFIVEDVFPATIDWSVTHLRFVHAVPNANALTLFATNTETGVETAIGGQVAYRSGSAFVALPPGTYNLSARAAGSTTSVIVRANVALAPGRVYTIGARGNATLTTGANAPFLDFTSNRQG